MNDSEKIPDCIACRMISGSGLIGAGAYIALQSKQSSNNYGKGFMLAMSLGFAMVGSARLLNLYPFNTTHTSIENSANRRE